MSNTLDILVKLQDQASAAFKQLESNAKKSLQGIESSTEKVSQAFKSFVSSSVDASGKFATALGIATTATAGLGIAAVNTAGNFEVFETKFKVLLGSQEAAIARMEELKEFSASTPFQLEEITQASVILQTLTDGLLATGDGLEMVGDLAAVAQVPIDEMAVTVGRFYDAIQSGRPFGETALRLQELGILSGETLTQLQAMQEAGMSGAEVWEYFENSVAGFNGMMDEMSKTFKGKMSNVLDAISLVSAEIGEMLLPYLKDAADAFLAWVDSMGGAEGIAQKLLAVLQKIAPHLDVIAGAIAGGLLPTVGKLTLGFLKFASILGPWMLLGAGIVLLVEGIQYAFENWGDEMQAFVDKVSPIFQAIYDSVALVFNSIVEVISAAMGAIIPIVVPIWEYIRDSIIPIISEIAEFIGTVLGASLKLVWDTASAVYNAVIPIVTAIKDFIVETFGIIRDVINGDMANVQEVLSAIWEAITNLFMVVTEALYNLVSSVFSAIKDYIVTIMEGIGEFLTNIWERIKTAIVNSLNAILLSIQNVLAFIWNSIVEGFNAVSNFVISIWESIKGYLVGAWESMGESFSSLMEGIKQAWVEFWQALYDWMVAKLEAIIGWISDFWDGVKGVFGIGGDEVKSSWAATMSSLADSASANMNSVQMVIAGAIAAIKAQIASLNATKISIGGTIAVSGWSKGSKSFALGGEVERFSDGGMPTFSPVGTDVVPAILTPGERVLSVEENRLLDKGLLGGNRLEINIHNPVILRPNDVMDVIGNPLVRELKKHLGL